MDYRKIDKMITKYIFIIAGLLILVYNFSFVFNILKWFYSAFSNILIACMVAYVINLIMRHIENLLEDTKNNVLIRYKRGLSLLISFIIIGVVFYFLINLIVPEFINAISVLFETLPSNFERFRLYLVKVFEDIPNIAQAISNLQIDWQNVFDSVLSIAGTGLTSLLDTTFNLVSTIAGSAFNILLICIFAIYILLEKDRFKRLYYRLTHLYLSERMQKSTDTYLHVFHSTFSSFIAGQCIEACILGVAVAGVMLVFRLPYAIMIGTLVGTINIIPIVGAYVGGAIGMFMVFTVDPIKSLIFLGLLIIVQQIESNYCYPLVVGGKVGLPGIYVLASVMVFGALAGIPGMLLGIPVVASLYKIIKMHVEYKESLLSIDIED